MAGGAYVIFRRRSRAISITDRRRRIYLAAYFALVLTPSLLTDLWLFAIPAPALIGFFMLLPSLFFIEQWPGTAYAIAMLYVGPILLCFGVFYAILTLYARLRTRRTPPPPI